MSAFTVCPEAEQSQARLQVGQHLSANGSGTGDERELFRMGCWWEMPEGSSCVLEQPRTKVTPWRSESGSYSEAIKPRCVSFSADALSSHCIATQRCMDPCTESAPHTALCQCVLTHQEGSVCKEGLRSLPKLCSGPIPTLPLPDSGSARPRAGL